MRKIIVIGLGILTLYLTVSKASTLDCQTSYYLSNLIGRPSGVLYLNVFSDGDIIHDTAYQADTNDFAIDLGLDTRRIAVSYDCKIYNAFCAKEDWDSAKVRIAYLWSNNKVNWSRLDSSAAITDTIPHTDTLIVRPYRYLKVIAYPSRSNVMVIDTTGAGDLSTTFLRAVNWAVTKFR